MEISDGQATSSRASDPGHRYVDEGHVLSVSHLVLRKGGCRLTIDDPSQLRTKTSSIQLRQSRNRVFRICMRKIAPGPADFSEVHSLLYSSLKASIHSASMELVKALQTSEPRITKGSHDTLYCWPGTLAVIVHKDQTLGPFATTGPWSKTDVTNAMTDYLRSARGLPTPVRQREPLHTGRGRGPGPATGASLL